MQARRVLRAAIGFLRAKLEARANLVRSINCPACRGLIAHTLHSTIVARPPRPVHRTMVRSAALRSAACLSGEYGMNGLYVGLLAVIGAGGVEHVVEIARDDDERATFAHSVNAVRTLLEAVVNLTA